MQTDPRIRNHAEILVRYCIQAKPHELVSVDGSPGAESLIVALHRALLEAGAYPLIRMTPEACAEQLFTHGQAHHFDVAHAMDRAQARLIHASIRMYSSSNTRALSAVDPHLQTRIAKATRPIRREMLKKKWVLTLHPTAAYAQDADMSLSAFEDFVYGALFADRDNPVAAWNELEKSQAKLIRKIQGADHVRIVGEDTDLTLSIKGRLFVNSAGIHNMPSGEIFTGPVENSAEGYIRYDFPVCHNGREVDGIRLVFRKGRVVEATATKNEAYLHTMLDMDPGARRLGELGIGTHYGIDRFIKNILFDEKIGGTVHLALGQSYTETGGRNQSALHWDMIKDLRKGGAIYVDGRVFQKDGKFV